MVNKAAFSLEDYKFRRVLLDLNKIHPNSKFNIDFKPSGIFHSNTGVFDLTFNFLAKSDDTDISAIEIDCSAEFKFQDVNSLEEIPDYFYANSIAIIFPYLRAFVSTVTLQANIVPLLLPTMNLSNLQVELKAHTVASDE